MLLDYMLHSKMEWNKLNNSHKMQDWLLFNIPRIF